MLSLDLIYVNLALHQREFYFILRLDATNSSITCVIQTHNVNLTSCDDKKEVISKFIL